MALLEITGLIILGFALGAQLKLRSLFVSRPRFIAAIAAGMMAVVLAYLTLQLYDGWRTNPVGIGLLPPHQSWHYFAGYVLKRLWGPWLISGVAGVAVFFAARILNRRFDERFFETEEPFLFGFTVFIVGYPNFLFYILFVFIVGILLTLGYAVVKKGRAPLYPLWLPLGIFAILVIHFVFPAGSLGKFNF